MKVMNVMPVFLLVMLVCVVFFGCVGSMEMARYQYEEIPAAKEAEFYVEEKPMVSRSEGVGASPVELAYVPVMPEDRKRVYSGFCQLRVESVEKTKDSIFSMAEQSGGYVESSYSDTIVIRVPAERFSEIFNTILGLGEILDKRIETYDVTEKFQDLAARLEIAEKTRERLYKLLEDTDDVEERFRILKEIRRLTDEIEGIKQNMEMIEKQISFSRITVGLIPRLAQQPAGKENIPFYWIRNLDPLYVSLRSLKGRIAFELGEEFAVFEREVAFRAESTEGTRVRVGSTRNDPLGDSSFWQKALSYYLSKYYRETVDLELGEVKGALFTSKDTEPFYYLAGVVAEKTTIYVIEVFFPDRAALDNRLDNMKESLRRFSIK